MAGIDFAQAVRRRPAGLLMWPSLAWSFIRRWPVVPLAVLAALAFCAIFAPAIAPHDPIKQSLVARNAPPALWNAGWYDEHPRVTERYILGADFMGRDVLSRLVYGARVSLMVAAVATASGIALGTLTGLASGYYGGLLDELIMRLVDIWYAVPFLLIALVVAVTIGQGVAIMMALLAMTTWVGLVRNVRAEVLTLKTRDYVALARVAGSSDWRIMLRHILPGVVSIVVVLASLRVGGLILAEAALSYLGAGIPAHIPSWGFMISDGRNYLATSWWSSVFPGMAIFLTVMSLNFLGDWLRDHFDPRLRQV